jgi:hypothetical protein
MSKHDQAEVCLSTTRLTEMPEGRQHMGHIVNHQRRHRVRHIRRGAGQTGKLLFQSIFKPSDLEVLKLLASILNNDSAISGIRA